MKINSPKNIALLNALVITIISGVTFFIIMFINNKVALLSIVLFCAVIFSSSYVFINFSLNRFFNEKIKVIYKTIGQLSPKPEENKSNNSKGDVLEIVNQVVLRWSKEKKKEAVAYFESEGATVDEAKKLGFWTRNMVTGNPLEKMDAAFSNKGEVLYKTSQGSRPNALGQIVKQVNQFKT
jgi:hypothetical protein